MIIGIPQIILIVIVCISIGSIIQKHGEQRTGEYGYIDWLISPIILLSLLYWGGFFG